MPNDMADVTVSPIAFSEPLAFSGAGTLAREAERLPARGAAIALEEGVALQLRKTRVMRRMLRQKPAGVAVNRDPSLPRDEFDVLKAMLSNCIRHGPASQHRASSPDFRATRPNASPMQVRRTPRAAAKLHALFARIAWEGAASVRKPPRRCRRSPAGEGKFAPDRKSART